MNDRSKNNLMVRRAVSALLLCTIPALATACGTGTSPDDGATVTSSEPSSVINELMTRPSIEQMATTYEEMQKKILQRLAADLGLRGFQEEKNSGSQGGGCGTAFPGVDNRIADQRTLNRWVLEGKIEDKTWASALRVVSQVAHEYGFKQPVPLRDKPGDHEYSIADKYGGYISFGSAATTAIQIYTSCHPFADSKGGSSASPATK